ncbi:Sorting and assembly machinery component 50 -like protein Alike, partial [Caligus rogercresseyi]
MDKRRSMDSDEYQSYLADIRDKKRSRILKALKKKKEIYEKSTRKLHALRAQYSKIPAVTSRIHFDGLIRTQEDVLLIPEVKKLFASVHNFEELISATHSVIAMLSDLGCFDDVFAEIDTDESSN